MSYKENNVRISVIPKDHEIVEFFIIDGKKKNNDCKIRERLGIEGEISDLIVVYKNLKDNKTIYCIIELKSGNFKKAVSQILNTYKYLIRVECCCSPIEWRAFMCFNLGPPIRINDHTLNTLKKTFPAEKSAHTKQQGNDNLGRFLRNN